MAHLLKNHPRIRGVCINNIEEVLSQFADDTTAFLTFDPLCIQAFCDVLELTERNIGLEVSYDKTAMYRVGSLHNSSAKCYTTKPLTWTNDDISTLGVAIPCGGDLFQPDHSGLLSKLTTICESWYNRTLSLMGKVTVINSLMYSIFVYKMLTLPNYSDQQLQEIDSIIYNFIWKGKKARIAKTTLNLPRSQGGLNLCNLTHRQDALKMMWIFEDDPTIKHFAHEKLSKSLGDLVWKCNLSEKDARKAFVSSIWQQVMLPWCKVNFCEVNISNVRNQVIWLNSHIRISNRPIQWTTWILKDIVFLCDLLDVNNCPIAVSEFARMHQLNWLDVKSLYEAIPTEWWEYLQDDKSYVVSEPLHDKVLRSKQKCRDLYLLLNSNPQNVDKYRKRWEKDQIMVDADAFVKAFQKLYRYTHISRLRDFQYRLLLGKNSDGPTAVPVEH